MQKLREIGIQPDVLICRCERPHRARHEEEDRDVLQRRRRRGVHRRTTSTTIYELPLDAARSRASTTSSAELLNIWSRAPRLERVGARSSSRSRSRKRKVTIGFVGKYVELIESYKSLNEALLHGGIANDCRVDIRYIDSRGDRAAAAPTRCSPTSTASWSRRGFGARGTEGKIAAVRYAREKKVPFFGICFGMQMAVHRVRAQRVRPRPAPTRPSSTRRRRTRSSTSCTTSASVTDKGGTMRLGAYPVRAQGGHARARGLRQRPRSASATATATRSTTTTATRSSEQGMVLSGLSPDGRLVEMIELPRAPVLRRLPVPPRVQVAPVAPHPLFARFIKARGPCEHIAAAQRAATTATASKARPRPPLRAVVRS